jgi:hypothetical protein
MHQSGKSINYCFDGDEDTSKWGIIATEETDASTHNSAIKINPGQSISIFVEKDSTKPAQKVQFDWNKHGSNPAIFDLTFLIDNNDKSIENDKNSEWIKTDNFQMDDNETHNLTWRFDLKDNWKRMNPNLWNSSCWIDNVLLDGSKIIREHRINVTKISIKPEMGKLNQSYRYVVNFDGLDESDIDSIRLDFSDDTGMKRSPANYTIHCNKSYCVFDINGFPLLDNYLGYIRYNIIYKNVTLIEGNGPQIVVTASKIRRTCEPNGKCNYILSARSSLCPTNFTLCYKDGEIWNKLETYEYNSCPELKSFECINHPMYETLKVVNGCECG